MAHEEQTVFCKSVKEKFPKYFQKSIVVDVGSLDINGNNKYLFEDSVYMGVDLLPGNNVDLTFKGHELSFSNESIDIIVSTECFEHDQFYSLTLKNIIRMLKPGGLFLFTCATTGRPEHGTKRTSPQDSPLTQEFGEWGEYYKNLEESDIREVIDIDKIFADYSFAINTITRDLYFWGIKSVDYKLPKHYYDINFSLALYTKFNRELLEILKKQNTESLAKRDKLLLERDRILLEYDNLKNEYDKKVKQLQLIQGSLSWRLTEPLRKIKNKIIYCIMSLFVRIKSKLIRILKNNIKIIRNKVCCDTNSLAHMEIVTRRNQFTKNIITNDYLTVKPLDTFPNIDISIVTYNSEKWLESFIDSLLKLNYPHSKISLFFVDNDSNDNTVKQLDNYSNILVTSGFVTNIIKSVKNTGFGSGHNMGIRAGRSEYCLVTNIDLVFEADFLSNIVSIACSDLSEVAAWELRQKPYEHPKFYDPVSGLTNWNSHACILIRRSAFEKVGGYDETIFMYGEDVELSYRFRQHGYLLRYCPVVSVDHYSYTEPNQLKHLQYIGSIFANLYIRLKYGRFCNIVVIPLMMFRVLLAPQVFQGSRLALLCKFIKLIILAPKILFSRSYSSNIYHPFRNWDYDMVREERSFILIAKNLPKDQIPLVSVITRTYKGRELFLKQAMLTVAHQTYKNIEHIIVQDGGSSMTKIAKEISKITGTKVTFIGAEKIGRSASCNLGLSKSKGKFCIFLDDDDLFFSDHIEVLVTTLINNHDAVAAYSAAWDIKSDYILNSDKDVIDYKEFINADINVIKQPFDREILKNANYIPIQAIMFLRELYEKRGGCDEDLDALEDWLLWNRYANGNKFVFVQKSTSIYRTPYDKDISNKRIKIFKETYNLVKERINNIKYPPLFKNITLVVPKMLFPAGHFYSPIVDTNYIGKRSEVIWNAKNEMTGINLNVNKQLRLLKLLKPYTKSINYPVDELEDPTIFYYKNDQYPALDAEFLYTALCYYKPKNMIEVGSGFSSLITADVNKSVFNNNINFTCIEPYPRKFLINGVKGITKLIINRLENIDLILFTSLNTGDILFIDTSHVSKTGSDVNYLFFEILPILKSGVIVHIHDIFLPDEYPKRWVIDEGRHWNEQYLLRAFMQNNNEWEIIWAANFMSTRFSKQVLDTFPNYLKLGAGGSFWIRKR